MYKLDDVSTILKEGFNYIGLNDFQIEINYIPDRPYDIVVSLYKTIELERRLEDNYTDIIDNHIKPILKSIEESDAVKVILLDKNIEIKHLTEQCQRFKNNIEELQQYKNYYDIQMKLNHGKE